MSLRFEFFHNPLFILMIGMSSQPGEWVMIRRYTRRGEMAGYEICFILFYAFCFMLVVFMSGTLIYNMVLHQPFTEIPSLLVFAGLFYLVTVSIGLLFLSVGAASSKVISSIILIALVVLDRFTAAIIPSIFYGQNVNPSTAACVLLLVIGLISFIIVFQMKGKDYYGKDESH